MANRKNRGRKRRGLPPNPTGITMHPALSEWTLDEVAEALDGVSMATSGVLWGLRDDDSSNNTPMGGDGTGGTVETPDGRLGDFDDKLARHWHKLTADQQNEINEAARKMVDYRDVEFDEE